MPTTLGYAIRAAFQREALISTPTWPSASAAACTALLPLLDAQVGDGVNKTGAYTQDSGFGPIGYDLTGIVPAITLPLQMRYQGLEQLWACALGFMAGRISGTLMPQTLATGAYRHLYELDDHLSALWPWMYNDGWQFQSPAEITWGARKVRRGTVALDLQSEVWELKSAMVNAWTLAANPQGVTLTLELLAHSLSRSGTVNTSATLTALAPNVSPRLRFDALTFRIAPFSSSVALNSGDALAVSAWALRVENKLQAGFGPMSGLAPEEFERSQAVQVTLTFVVPRHTAATWQTRWTANTRLMADAKWTGPAIGATGQNYQCNVYLPSLQVSNAQLGINGAALPPDTVQCLGIVPTVAAAGFPAMNNLIPLAVECVSGTSTHSLAATTPL